MFCLSLLIIKYYFSTLLYCLIDVITISVPDLPVQTFVKSPAAITSVEGNGVYVQYDEKFYELNCKVHTYKYFQSCKWTVMSQTLPKPVLAGIMMYLPPELTCFS